MSGLGLTYAGAKLAVRLGKGPYTNDPRDPAYTAYWNAGEAPGGVEPIAVHPGVAVRGRNRTPVNIRIFGNAEGERRYLIDTPNHVKVGVVGAFAGRALDRGGLATHYEYGAGEVIVKDIDDQHTRISTPDLDVTMNKQGFVGRPSDLSPKGQLKQTWNFLHG